MKFFILILSFLFISHPLHAASKNLLCEISKNKDLLVQKNVSVPLGSKVLFAQIESYEFKMQNLGQEEYELEVYNIYEPSRTYIQTRLFETQDILKYTLWNRNILLEVQCKTN